MLGTRACCNNMRDIIASLVDMPRLYRLGTRIGHDTVNEKHVVDMGTSRGYGGNMERVPPTCTCVDMTCECCCVVWLGLLPMLCFTSISISSHDDGDGDTGEETMGDRMGMDAEDMMLYV
jgi:hypothetical protein